MCISHEGSFYLTCNEKLPFFIENYRSYNFWSCQKVCDQTFDAVFPKDRLSDYCEAFFFYLLDNIFIRFGTKLYTQIVGIPMGTNCDPLGVDLNFSLKASD